MSKKAKNINPLVKNIFEENDIEDKIISMYGRGISRITDKILACYPFVFLDATYFNVKSNGKIIKKATYVIVGIDLEGQKDILSVSF